MSKYNFPFRSVPDPHLSEDFVNEGETLVENGHVYVKSLFGCSRGACLSGHFLRDGVLLAGDLTVVS